MNNELAIKVINVLHTVSNLPCDTSAEAAVAGVVWKEIRKALTDANLTYADILKARSMLETENV